MALMLYVKLQNLNENYEKVFLFALLLCAIGAAAQPGRRKPNWTTTDPDVHDPVIARGEDGRFYIFSTGMNVGVMSSADLKEWKMERPALPETPVWAKDTVPPSYQLRQEGMDCYRITSYISR